MSIFHFEFKKILAGRNLILLFIIAIIINSFLYLGIDKHKKRLKSIEAFQEAETAKVKQYRLYNQYGGFGIRFLFIPAVTNVFASGDIDALLLSKVNAAETLDIVAPYKGKNFFFRSGKFKTIADFTDFFLIFGCFIVLIYGAAMKKDYFKILSNFMGGFKAFISVMTAKILIITVVYFILLLLSFSLVLLCGLEIQITHFFPWFFVGLIVFVFFFSVGHIISQFKKKVAIIIALGAVYLSSVVIIPMVIYQITELRARQIPELSNFELENIKLYHTIEKKLFARFGAARELKKEEIKPFMEEIDKAMDAEFKSIFDREKKMKQEISDVANFKQYFSSIYPSSFLLSSWQEMSGAGYKSLLEFYEFSLQEKKKFLKFIIQKTILNKNKPGNVENFIKGYGNIFYAKSTIPNGFWPGIGLTLFYSLILFFAAFRIHKNEMKIQEPVISPQITHNTKNVLFILCESEKIKDAVFNSYKDQRQPRTICIDKINTPDFQFYGITSRELFAHLCRVSGVDGKKAMENLKLMDIKDLSIFDLDRITILKIYTAVKTAGEYDLIVFNDFIKRESRKFEIELFKLLSALETSGKKIIYLSCEIYNTANNFGERIHVEKYKDFPLNLQKVTLR